MSNKYLFIFLYTKLPIANKHCKSKVSCLKHFSLLLPYLILDMSDTPAGLRDVLSRYRNLDPEQAAHERSTDYVAFLDVEETRLRRLIANLRFNQDFEKSYYERQLSLCVYLLKLWSKRSKKASKALKRCLRRPGSSTGNRSSASDSSDSSDSDSSESETNSSESETGPDSN